MESVRSLTQAYSQAPWRKQLAMIVLFLLMVVFVALIAGIYLDVTARTATIGREVQIMQREIESLKLVNADLDSQLAVLVSSGVMERRARDLGFERVQRDQITYVLVPGYQPRQQPRLAPPPATVKTVAAALPSIFTESLFDFFNHSVLPEVRRMLEVNQ
jgi:cell division protein FtsL